MELKFTQISNILSEVQNGRMKNVSTLCSLIRNNDPWLETLDGDTAYKVALVLNKIIDSKINTLKFRLEFAIIICEILNKSTAKSPISLFKACIFTVSQFILELILNCEDMKYLRTCINLLNLFKIGIIKGVIPFNNSTERLLEGLMAITLSKPICNELKNVSMLIIIAVGKHMSKLHFIVDLFLCEINDPKNVLSFKINVDNQKISFVSYFLMSFVQNLLDRDSPTACTAAKAIVTTIIDKCRDPKDFSNFSALFDKILSDVLVMSNSLLWPVTGLLIAMLFKELTRKNEKYADDWKYTIFAVTQYTKIALKGAHNYYQFKEIESMLKNKIQNPEDWVGGLIEIILCIITNMEKKEANGDVARAYKIFWPKDGKCLNFPDKTENDALAAKYLLEYRNKHIHYTVEQIVTICSNRNKLVKNAGVKSLCDLISSYPNLFFYEMVQNALLENYELICATGRDKMAYAVSCYVDRYPRDFAKHENLFIRLLKDQSPSVGRAALKSVTFILSKHNLINNSLFIEVVKLFSSTDEGTKNLVFLFFKTIWLKNKHLSSLINICKTKECETISNLFEHAKSKKFVVETKEKLVIVTKSLVNHFNEKEESTRLATAKLFLIITKTFPMSIVPHISLLTELLFNSSDTEIQFKHVLCKILTILGSDVKKAGLKIQEPIEKALVELTNLPSYCFIEFIKLMFAVSDDTKKVKNELFNVNFKILEDVYGNKQKYNLQEINSAINYVLTICLDYGKNEKTLSIIHFFLSTPKYSSTVLSALSEVRKMFIPIKQEPNLVDILVGFLNDSSSLQRVRDTLYYLQCLIKGSNKIKHVSNIKNVGDPTNEYVSFYVQNSLAHVINYCSSYNIFLRKSAFKVLISILESGLILFPRLLPTLVASSTDNDDDIRNEAIYQLDLAKHWDLSLECIQSLKLCYKLAQNLYSNSLTRGFNFETFESTCSSWLKMVLKSQQQIRAILIKLMTEIEKTTDLNFAVYLLDILVYMPPTNIETAKFLYNLFGKTISNLPSDIQEKKVCFLTKAEDYFDSLYKISSKNTDNNSPNTKNVMQRKGELKDYLPHLDSRMIEIKLEEDHSEMTCSLAELQSRLIPDCFVLLESIDTNTSNPCQPTEEQLKLTIKRKSNSENHNWEVKKKKTLRKR